MKKHISPTRLTTSYQSDLCSWILKNPLQTFFSHVALFLLGHSYGWVSQWLKHWHHSEFSLTENHSFQLYPLSKDLHLNLDILFWTTFTEKWQEKNAGKGSLSQKLSKSQAVMEGRPIYPKIFPFTTNHDLKSWIVCIERNKQCVKHVSSIIVSKASKLYNARSIHGIDILIVLKYSLIHILFRKGLWRFGCSTHCVSASFQSQSSNA